MKSSKIELSPQVADFLRTLAPHPRKQLRTALRDLAMDKGDIIELEHPLDGFHRLRSGRYRIIFQYIIVNNDRVIRCEFAEARKLVYEVFTDLIKGS